MDTSSSSLSSSSSTPSYRTIVTPQGYSLHYRSYASELDIGHILSLCSPSLSEPYSLYTYRYFVLNFGECCWFAFRRRGGGEGDKEGAPKSESEEREQYDCVGCCICKVDR